MKDYQSHEQLQAMAVPERPSDRSFGIVFCVFLSLFALLPLIGGGGVRTWPFWPSGALLLIALIYSRLLMPFNRGWWRFALVLPAITPPVLIVLVFLLAVAPLVWRMCFF